jgi:hypothetical protein
LDLTGDNFKNIKNFCDKNIYAIDEIRFYIFLCLNWFYGKQTKFSENTCPFSRYALNGQWQRMAGVDGQPISKQ